MRVSESTQALSSATSPAPVQLAGEELRLHGLATIHRNLTRGLAPGWGTGDCEYSGLMWIGRNGRGNATP